MAAPTSEPEAQRRASAFAASETKLFLGTVILLASVMNMIGRGTTEAFAVFLLPVQQEFETTRSAVTVTYSLYILVLGCTGPFVGQIVDRLGVRASYGLGVAALGGSYLLASFAGQLWHYVLIIGLLSGFGAASLGMVVASSLLSRWFTQRLGSVMSIPYGAVGGGMLFMPVISQILLDHGGWRFAHRAIGIAILCLLPMVLLLPLGRMSRGSEAWQSARAGAVKTAGSTWTLTNAAKTDAFWGMIGAYFFTSVASFSVVPHTVAYLVERGFDPLLSASVFGMAGALAAAGIISMGVLSDRIGRVAAATLSYSSTIIGIGLLICVTLWPSLVLVYAFVLFFGSMQGARGPIIVAMLATMYRGGNVGSIFGVMSLGMGLGGALGSWSSGLLHDVTGGYVTSFLVGIAAAFGGMGCFWLVPSMRRERLVGRSVLADR